MIDDLELVGLDGWINSDPLSVTDLIGSGRVVLLDFWTYTCVNCVRTFPYLSAWHETYREHGLTVIGVHSPEFEFEKLPLNVRRAVERYGLTYAVALDGNKETWERYGNRFWPSKYLIGASGEVVFRHFGEGGYDETESVIRAELEAVGNDLSGVARSSVAEPRRSEAAHTVTRELYGGYKNNYLSDGLYAGQDVYYETPDVAVEYTDDGTRRRGQFYLDGVWTNSLNAVVTANRSDTDSAYFAFDFFATSVNSVLGNSQPDLAGAGQDNHEVVVELDGRPLSPDEAGADIEWDSEGNSVLQIGETRLYQIVALPEFGNHELKLTTNSEGLAVYTITFGIFESGP
jgi:thiol-disulfide isomerase/thioredoxin